MLKILSLLFVFSSHLLVGQSLIEEAKHVAPRCLSQLERQRFFLAPEVPEWCNFMQKWPYDANALIEAGVELLEKKENDAKAEATIDKLAGPDHQADWGMRIISSQDPRYGPDGYHYGAVWPLFTGWAATGEYRYHRAFPAYANLRANALMALDGSLGHVTEVLSGDYYQPTVTSSPHQIWSAAMVVSPLLRGMMGLDTDVAAKKLRFAPHVPADWNSFSIANVRVGAASLSLKYSRTADAITLESSSTEGGECSLEFSPALSLRAQVQSAELNGKPVQFRPQTNSSDQHVSVTVPACIGTNQVVIRLRNDFVVGYNSALPLLGSRSEGLRVTSESWSSGRDTLTLNVSGLPGRHYDLSILDPSQIASLDGADLVTAPLKGNDAILDHSPSKVRIHFPPGESGAYVQRTVVFHFMPDRQKRR